LLHRKNEPESQKKIQRIKQDEKKARERMMKVLKNKSFHNEKQINESHPHIADWFNTTRDKEKQNEIVENCFRKTADGKWRMALDRPYFKESKQRCVCVCEHHGSLYNFRVLKVLEHCIDFRVF